MRRYVQVLSAATLVAMTGCGAAAASPSHAARAALTAASITPTTTVTVTGTGTVSAMPDVMTIQIGVDNTAPHVAAALSANNSASAAVQAALVRQGVRVADIQTTQLSLYAGQSRGGVTTYHVTDEVSATLHDLAKAGAVVDEALAAAGDAGRLDGVTFSFANNATLLARARAAAVSSAQTDAQQLAAASGLKLLGLRSITDQTGQNGNPDSFPIASAGLAESASVPLQPGTQQTTVQITAVWAVGP